MVGEKDGGAGCATAVWASMTLAAAVRPASEGRPGWRLMYCFT